jgi:DNA-binding IclR family transcriptional regulator
MDINSLKCETATMSQVPAANRTLEVLLLLARSASPIAARTIGKELAIPKSSLYHLLAAMQSKGFVTPIAGSDSGYSRSGNSQTESALWGLGVSAFEVGSAYMRHAPLEARAHPVLLALMKRVAAIAPLVGHLGILRGSDTYYLLKESTGGPITVISEVGVRLPASLTASGRAMLSFLSPAQVRALFPSSQAFINRTGKGPQNPAELKALLIKERKQGFSIESGLITPEHSSVAAAVFDHLGEPVAAINLVFRDVTIDDSDQQTLIEAVQDSARELTKRLGGRLPSGSKDEK